MEKAIANDIDLTFAEEALVVDVQLFLHNLMLEKGFNRADLAKAMGVSRARVTQIFSDDCKNFTVRLFARAAGALGERVELDCDHFKRARKNREYKSIYGPECENVVPMWEELILPIDADAGSRKIDSFINHSIAGLAPCEREFA